MLVIHLYTLSFLKSKTIITKFQKHNSLNTYGSFNLSVKVVLTVLRTIVVKDH